MSRDWLFNFTNIDVVIVVVTRRLERAECWVGSDEQVAAGAKQFALNGFSGTFDAPPPSD